VSFAFGRSHGPDTARNARQKCVPCFAEKAPPDRHCFERRAASAGARAEGVAAEWAARWLEHFSQAA
jgi:hypothetical protein